jgi:Zn-dependent protease
VIFRFLPVIGDAPDAVLILLLAFTVTLLLGLAFHEFMHAFVADRLGDPTPRAMGRLTLDPRAHFDPVGSTLIFFAGFGWAKPVPINPMNTANPRRSMAIIAGAGPVSNLFLAALAAIPIRLGWVGVNDRTGDIWHPFIHPSTVEIHAQLWTQSFADLAGLFFGTVLLLNVLLAVFNLLPIPPLDGYRVALGVLPPELGRELVKIEPWGFGILMLLFFAPFLTGGQINPLFAVMGPILNVLLEVFAGGAAIDFG